tara:strand:- start:446 stop:667 length:222 start_codon:yes stop_codon:yes gene_type:complete
MFAINTTIRANGGMADTHVLGTCPVMGIGSSPISPTTTATQWINGVAQGVALAITCCTKNSEKEIFKGKTIGH